MGKKRSRCTEASWSALSNMSNQSVLSSVASHRLTLATLSEVLSELPSFRSLNMRAKSAVSVVSESALKKKTFL